MRTGGFETSQRSGDSYQTVNPGDVFVALSLCVLRHQWMWRRGQFISGVSNYLLQVAAGELDGVPLQGLQGC